jgi:hypothetical protein
MSDAERARQAVGLRTFNEVWGAMLEDVIGMWALNAPDLDDVLDVLADHSHEVEASLPAQAVEPGPLDVERLAAVLAVSPIAWEVHSASGGYVMTLMFETADEAAAHIAAEYARLSPDKQPKGAG